jgi:hypothetical protein
MPVHELSSITVAATSTVMSAGGRSQLRVLLAFDGGGFLAETTSVIWGLHDHFELHLTSPLNPQGFNLQSIPSVPLHPFTRTTRIGERHGWQRVSRFVRGMVDARRVIATVRPHAVVCLGSSIAVPLFLVARTSGVTTVSIESLTRVSRGSITGKLVDLLGLCDRLYRAVA